MIVAAETAFPAAVVAVVMISTAAGYIVDTNVRSQKYLYRCAL